MSAAASYWRNAVRHPEDCGIGNIRRTFDYTEFGNMAGEYPAYALPIGCLEKGAVPLRISTRVQTAVTGGTPAVTIGTSTDPDAFAVAADIAAGSTGYKTAATGVEMGKALTADTMFFAYISTSASAGKFTTTVEFANRRESIPFREDATDAGEGEEGGGEEDTWPPAGAKVAIDFLENLAWVDGTGAVAINTLLGNDPNADAASAYNPANLTANGYVATGASAALAYIGAARTLLASAGGFTIRAMLKNMVTINSGKNVWPMWLISADHADHILNEWRGSSGRFMGQSAYGDLWIETATDVFVRTSGAVNACAMTIAGERCEMAGNGSAAMEGVIGENDRPPGNPLVACKIVTSLNYAIQSITIYDPLASTAGLSELSEP